MVTLLPTNIEVGVDGRQWVIINRVKTDNRCAIPLLPTALEILTKYDYKLPFICNQKLNKYLKEVAELCSITKVLTSHVGRPGIESIENPKEVIKLSNQFNAIPVFAGVRLSCVSTDENSISIYGAGYIAEFTGFKEI
jgi:hypothetical protein